MIRFVRHVAGAVLVAAAGVAIPSGAAMGQKVSPVRTGARSPTRGPATGMPTTMSAADRSTLLRLVAVEDARALGAGGEAPLVEGLRSASAVVRRAAVRALGRLQRPALLSSIEPALRDADSVVRVEAANAVGQALQGLRAQTSDLAVRRETLDAGVDALVRAAERFPDPAMLGTTARTLGRLPFSDSIVPREVERVIVEMGNRVGGSGRPLARADARVATGMMHGLYSLARARRATGDPSAPALSAMRWATRFGLDSGVSVVAGGEEPNAEVRRLAYLALAAAGDTSSELVRRAQRDGDEQVRRLAVVWSSAFGDTAVRRAAVVSALRDPSFLVRFEATRSYRTLPSPRPCAPLIVATRDPNAHVMLAAIDALGTGCDDRAIAADTLGALIASHAARSAVRQAGGTSWHVHAHALAALATIAPAMAIPLLRRDARHPLWQLRLYAARAAMTTRDSLTLSALAFDANGDVRAAALAGISATVGHLADRVFTAALAATDYHVVLQAAQALKGAPFPDSVFPALVAALERITAERRENSRDPRMAILERLSELGTVRQAQRLAPLAADFDSTVAQRAATILERWTLRRAVATPERLTPPADPVSQVVGVEWRLMIKLSAASGGGVIVVRLLPDEAPVTVARIIRLARAGYYAGLTFHRVEPAFVIQGGSPAATEYVGDGPFMRDEVGLRSHLRGTLGISTRGRDTGDAQLFVNLTDNFRLDHDYTVFGTIVQGRDVAEGVIEGDVIERMDVVRVR